jgi:hypothetical protein
MSGDDSGRGAPVSYVMQVFCTAQRARALCSKSPHLLGRRRGLGDGARLQLQRPVGCRVATRDSLFCG